MEADRVITGFKAQVDPDRLGSNLAIFAELTASAHDVASTRRVEAALRDMPEAIEAYQVSGSYDYLVRYLVPNMARWTDLADRLENGELKIATVRTLAAMRKLKGSSGVPVD